MESSSDFSIFAEEGAIDAEAAHGILLALSDSVASRMRAVGAKTQCVAVTIRGNDFHDHSHQRKLPDPTDATAEIYDTTKRLFSELWDGRMPLRLLGISLTDLSHGEETQMSLFADEQRERSRKLDRAMDAIRDKY